MAINPPPHVLLSMAWVYGLCRSLVVLKGWGRMVGGHNLPPSRFVTWKAQFSILA